MNDRTRAVLNGENLHITMNARTVALLVSIAETFLPDEGTDPDFEAMLDAVVFAKSALKDVGVEL